MLSKVIKVNEEVILSEQNDVFTILIPKTDDLMVTNRIGKIILDNNGQKIDQIVFKIKDTFQDIDQETIERDVLEFITDCQLKGVITIE